MAEDITKFKTSRAKTLETLYSDDKSSQRRYDNRTRYKAGVHKTAAAVREALSRVADGTDREAVVEASSKLFVTNPIYASVINYLSDMYMWRYKVVPHKVYTNSKAKAKKVLPVDNYRLMYNLMLEVVEGLSIETKFPTLLTLTSTTFTPRFLNTSIIYL